jgi:hypothetical protein
MSSLRDSAEMMASTSPGVLTIVSIRHFREFVLRRAMEKPSLLFQKRSWIASRLPAWRGGQQRQGAGGCV